MSEERRRILDMVAAGKISVAEAEQLLDALGDSADEAGGAEASAPAGKGGKRPPKFLRVLVESEDGDRVNVRVPVKLLRAGIKLGAVMPGDAQKKVEKALKDKGIDLNLTDVKSAGAIDELIEQLGELSVDVEDSDGDKVRIFCE